jgi:hypothetical protein
MGVYIDGSDAPTVDDDIPAPVLRLRGVYQAACDKRDAGDSAAGAAEQVPAGRHVFLPGFAARLPRDIANLRQEMITSAPEKHHRGDDAHARH